MIAEKKRSASSNIGKISMCLHANLARFVEGRTEPLFISIREGESLSDVIDRFQIPPSEISVMILNGNTVSDPQTPLRPGDEVRFLGIVGGG
jgi:molybdopterin converting factor small subunit